jgi:hypothetical protein
MSEWSTTAHSLVSADAVFVFSVPEYQHVCPSLDLSLGIIDIHRNRAEPAWIPTVPVFHSYVPVALFISERQDLQMLKESV